MCVRAAAPSPKLILVCGLPGSGKTTRAKALEERVQGVRLAPDEWLEALALSLHDEARRAQIEALQWTLGKQLLAGGRTVIIEWGTWGRWERDALRLDARALHAAVDLHLLSAPLDVLFERIARRGMEDPPIAREDLARWVGLFETPTPEELALFDHVER